jgi:hypothetical protein
MNCGGSKIRELSRRDFLKRTAKFVVGGCAGFALGGSLGGCASMGWDPKKSPPEQFTLEKFDYWFSNQILYNKQNTNLKQAHRGGNQGTFYQSVFHPMGATPGVDYSASQMVAAADGEILQ